MFKTADKSDLNQISLTGIRAIVLLGLLIIKPRTLEEIRRAFIEFNIMEESHSNDIIRIDINTIKSIGCEVSRADSKTNYQYVLLKHPFSLKFEEDEIKVLKRVYSKIKNSCTLDMLIEYDNLFKKIASYVYDEDIKEMILGISVLKNYDMEKINSLIEDCNKNKVLELIYKNPTTKNPYNKEVVALSVEFRNEKIYLHCFDKFKKENIVLNFKRIKKILSKKDNDSIIETKGVKVKFLLKDLSKINLEKKEEIIEQTEDGYIIEGVYYNKFIATQRIMSFGSNCIVYEPVEFKNNIIEKLKEMRNIYE